MKHDHEVLVTAEVTAEEDDNGKPRTKMDSGEESEEESKGLFGNFYLEEDVKGPLMHLKNGLDSLNEETATRFTETSQGQGSEAHMAISYTQIETTSS